MSLKDSMLLLAVFAVTTAQFASSEVADSVCGISSTRGNENKDNVIYKYPWISPMYAGDRGIPFQYNCIGTLITRQHVITAASCMKNKNKRTQGPNYWDLEDILFYFGVYELTEITMQKAVGSAVEKYWIHPEYVSDNSTLNFETDQQPKGDLAVSLLEKKLQITDRIRPICLDFNAKGIASLLRDKQGTVMGWQIQGVYAISRELAETESKIVPNTLCRQNKKLNTALTNATYCIGDPKINQCNGEPGSAFMVKKDSKWYLRGVVSLNVRDSESFTLDCKDTPHSVVTNVFLYKNWINGTIHVKPNVTRTSSLQHSLSRLCGTSTVKDNVTELVIMGSEYKMGKYPWLAPMFTRPLSTEGFNYQCVGNLISFKHVVTAAHCIYQKNKNVRIDEKNMIFVPGLHDLEDYPGGDDIKISTVSKYEIHPDYTRRDGLNDLAVVILKENVEVTEYIRPICLWSSNFTESLRDVRGVVAGWGLNEKRKISKKPKEVSMTAITNDVCEKESGLAPYVVPETFCAGDRKNETPCNGDSGSGFMLKKGSQWHIRGVVSLTARDPNTFYCVWDSYVVFTDIAKYLNWIFGVTGSIYDDDVI